MPKQHKLDVDYGADLLEYLRQAAAARGVPTAVVAKELARDARLRDSLFAQQITQAVIAVGHAVAPDERYDPADDPRIEEAVVPLAALLGSLPAAEGVASALAVLWSEWLLKEKES
jgi:hypothetical protein